MISIRSTISIAGKKTSGRIVGQSREYFDLVPASMQAEREIIDQKILRPEILRNDEYLHIKSERKDKENSGDTIYYGAA